MKSLKIALYGLAICLLSSISLSAQQEQNNGGGRFVGSLETNANFFIRDTLIGAANTPQYDRQLFGADAWLNMNYSNWGFDFMVRFDMFNNSNLLNPTGSYSAEGIGRWYIHKEIHNLGIHAGYIYDQIGSGIIFRAYEMRPLLIDNALYGIKLDYKFGNNWKVRAFSGKQKQQFETYESVIRGGAIEGYIDLGELKLSPGLGTVGRTLDDATMNNLVADINTYREEDKFVPTWNTYATSLYNTLSYKNLSWYMEAAYKTEDNLFDPLISRTTVSGDQVIGSFIQGDGSVLYSSLGYAQKGLGASFEVKRTENFSFRTRPQEELLRGLMNFLPPMTRVNTFRLPARYAAATQEIGELALQADLQIAPSRNFSVNINASYIDDLDQNPLYRELYTQFLFKKSRKWRLATGVQLQRYNQAVYLFKNNAPDIESITPFIEYTYKVTRKKSVRFELQYMDADQDFGSWVFGLAEFNIAPKWSFVASNMYNIVPNKENKDIAEDEDGNQIKVHYPRFDVFYTFNSNRISFSYIKQVEGIVCAGGVCRFEPAFSGFRLNVNSIF